MLMLREQSAAADRPIQMQIHWELMVSYDEIVVVKILIRQATPDDAEALIAHAESVMAENVYSLTEPGEFQMPILQEREWIRMMNDHPNHFLRVAEVSGSIVGMIHLSNGHRRRIAHTSEFGMSVSRPFRDQGIGRLLIQALLDWARENTVIEKISLKVHGDNSRAIHLYKTLGFVEEGCLKKEIKYGPNQYVDVLLLSKFV